jgi:Holliday junction resolvase
MPRYASNVDLNQKEIVDALRKSGVQVECTHGVGSGFPDLVCGWRGKTVLIEVKYGNDQLNAAQKLWHEKWAGQVGVARTFEEAMKIVLENSK